MELHDSLELSYRDQLLRTDAEVELAVMRIFDQEKIKMSARFYRTRHEALEALAYSEDPVPIDRDEADVWDPVVIECLAEYKRRIS